MTEARVLDADSETILTATDSWCLLDCLLQVLSSGQAIAMPFPPLQPSLHLHLPSHIITDEAGPSHSVHWA